ncbi:hypothetical protein HN592_04065 [Candidatus Woesearchaeota archaeon]|nr:hypothetical protein [Candidatus Woesearchaeota archaeon]MBT4368387.1 hypothetical protein [Candidatus Woesearchaeota archaeon]MBT4712876.1 hypothetical protein [Candidatus Woesearchaeota archaeon]MBT6639788.1 hypothetical protein [Candidatus Woesearchaeota archaeon]MBT7133960.1 hypothetical protein [Candidatus Woesearchaeota archaeon]
MSLEGIIDSDRYELVELVGRETWGKVYRTRDRFLDKEVAIKLIDPTERARQQMARWDLTLKDAIMKEAEELMACSNVVPRKYDEDKNGQGFIVMPFYKTFFNEVLDSVIKRKEGEGSGQPGEFLPETLFSSGLHIEEIIQYTRDVAKGIAEVNNALGRAHCDIKPDNIAIGPDGRLLLNDLGTATYLSIAAGDDSVRDNRGCLYTRSPLMFKKGYDPTKKEDAFSLASLMFKMFTGKYIFEDEINEALAKGGEDAVREYMLEMTYSGPYLNQRFSERAQDKVKNSEVPKEFQEFLLNSLNGHYWAIPSISGLQTHVPTTQDMLEQSVTLYRNNRAKDKAYKQLKKELGKKARSSFLTGAGATTFLLGTIWGIFLLPKVDYTERQDYEANMLLKPAEISNISFEIERPARSNWTLPKDQDYSGLLASFRKNSKGTVTDRIVLAYIQTLQELGHHNSKGADMYMRYAKLRYQHATGPRPILDEQLRVLLPHYGNFTRIDERVIDLEDCLATTYLGIRKVRDAQKAANDTDYHTYIQSRDRAGNLVINRGERLFLDRWTRNSKLLLPHRVCLKQN